MSGERVANEGLGKIGNKAGEGSIERHRAAPNTSRKNRVVGGRCGWCNESNHSVRSEGLPRWLQQLCNERHASHRAAAIHMAERRKVR